MPFREKMKKAFGRTTSEGSSPTVSKTNSNVEYYKTGEIPASKYRGPWNKQHQEKLHSFSFGEAFGRRKSDVASDYSPKGSRAPSRRESFLSMGRKSVQKNREQSHVGQVVENAGDDDPANVGLSRQHTAEKEKRPDTAEDETNNLKTQKTITNGDVNGPKNDTPFSEDELTKALTTTRSTDSKK